MSAYHLRTFYVARQATFGIPEAQPASVLQGVTDGKVTVKIEDEILNTIGRNVGNITIYKERESEITISLTATYEQILYIMHGLFGAVTPSGSAAPYTWTYTLPSNNSVIPQLYTIFYGIENNNYRLHSCFLTEMTVTGEANSTLNVDLTFMSPFAPEVFVLNNQPAFSVVNAVHVRDAIVYVTDATNYSLTSFEINVNTNRHVKRFVGNNNFYGEGQWYIDGSISLEYDMISRSLIHSTFNYITTNDLTFEFQPSYPNKKVSFTMPVLFTNAFDLYTNRDGNAVVQLQFVAMYNDNVDSAMRVEVLTDTNTLP